MSNTVGMIVIGMLFIGCVEPSPPRAYPRIDRCIERDVFLQCLDKIPKGPERVTATGNDWSETISECAQAAHYISLRSESQIKPECLGD